MRHVGAEITILYSCSETVEAGISSVIFLFFSPS